MDVQNGVVQIGEFREKEFESTKEDDFVSFQFFLNFDTIYLNKIDHFIHF